MNNKNNIELHIEQLVLHGIKPGDRHRIGRAVELELTRMLAEQELPSSFNNGTEVNRLNGGTFTMTPDSRPEAIGLEVAQSLFRGFGK